MADISKVLQIFSREEEEKKAQARAQGLKLGYVSLVGYPMKPQALQTIPEQKARQMKVVAYDLKEGRLWVATPFPENPSLNPFLRDIATMTNLEIVLSVCSQTSFDFMVEQFRFIEEAPIKLDKLRVDPTKVEAGEKELLNLTAVSARIRDASTTEVLEIIFGGALKLEASDIHLEPEETEGRLRYRIDGVLQDVTTLPLEVHKTLASRIKYLAKLKLDYSKKPQDGRFEAELPDRRVEIRVSAVPGQFGELYVMRLLDPQKGLLPLEKLGFREEARKAIEEAISRPYGAVFNTGPTGSGKTTTLYAILQKLNRPEVKIITLEDPIEYRLGGVNQTQINPAKGYDFATGLKSVLRQDPDILMIGEVRDIETAETVLQASMTGHLVLTTLHTNSAPSALPRLLDMGVRPFLLSGSINLIIAQRLVRKLCSACRGKSQAPNLKFSRSPDTTSGFGMPTEASAQSNSKSQIPNTKDSQQPAPTTDNRQLTITKQQSSCSVCGGTGYKGRIALVETLKISPKIEELINKKAPLTQFEKVAREEGMVTMFEDGMAKVKSGITSESEVRRVTSA